MRLLRLKDFAAGLVFLAIGIATLVIGQGYEIGTAAEMGPGYFPMLLALGLIGLGLVLTVKSWREVAAAARDIAAEEIEPGHWRPVVVPTLAIILFSLTLERFGLVIALVLLLGVGALASPQTRLREIPFLVIAGIAFSVLVFVYGVKLPISVWPR